MSSVSPPVEGSLGSDLCVAGDGGLGAEERLVVVGRGEEGGRVLGGVAGAALGELLDLVLLDLEAPGELAWKKRNKIDDLVAVIQRP